jgi:hypothetical protein
MTPHDTNCVIELVEEGMTILEAVSLTKAYGSNKLESMVDIPIEKIDEDVGNPSTEVPSVETLVANDNMPKSDEQENVVPSEEELLAGVEAATLPEELLQDTSKTATLEIDSVKPEVVSESSAKTTKRKRFYV